MLDPDAIRDRRWKQHPFDKERFAHVGTMLTFHEQRMLNWLSHEVGDLGCIIDAGAFLGGSTVQLADGLRDHPDPLKKVHSFDLFRVPNSARGRYGLAPETENSLAIYAQNIAPWADRVVVYPGDIRHAGWPPQPIELLFLDCLKSLPLNEWAVGAFLPNLEVGSILIQQDFLWPDLPWIHVTMGYFADHFSYLTDTGINSVVYVCDRPISAEAAATFDFRGLSRGERYDLFDRATARFTEQRETIEGARAKLDEYFPER